jgi:hypothetical protein
VLRSCGSVAEKLPQRSSQALSETESFTPPFEDSASDDDGDYFLDLLLDGDAAADFTALAVSTKSTNRAKRRQVNRRGKKKAGANCPRVYPDFAFSGIEKTGIGIVRLQSQVYRGYVAGKGQGFSVLGLFLVVWLFL